MQILELVFSAVLIIGCLVFAIAVLRMTRTPETAKAKRKKSKKAKTKKPKKRSKSEKEIPASWRKSNEGNPRKTTRLNVPRIERRKIRVPGLRMAWRILIGLLLIANFFISQATLMSAPATQPMFWLFFLNSVCLLWALWKTRRKETI